MRDDWRDGDDSVHDDGAGPSTHPVSDLRFASSLLRGAAQVSVVLWVIGVVT